VERVQQWHKAIPVVEAIQICSKPNQPADLEALNSSRLSCNARSRGSPLRYKDFALLTERPAFLSRGLCLYGYRRYVTRGTSLRSGCGSATQGQNILGLDAREKNTSAYDSQNNRSDSIIVRQRCLPASSWVELFTSSGSRPLHHPLRLHLTGSCLFLVRVSGDFRA